MFLEIILALLLGLLVAAALSTMGTSKGRRSPMAGFLFFFLIAFFFIWVAGTWAAPYGPPLGGVYWVPFIFWALIIGLIIAAVASSSRDSPNLRTPRSAASSAPSASSASKRRPLEPTEDEAPTVATAAVGAFGVIFFVLVALLAIAGVVAALD